jgi:hypothetical protein
LSTSGRPSVAAISAAVSPPASSRPEATGTPCAAASARVFALSLNISSAASLAMAIRSRPSVSAWWRSMNRPLSLVGITKRRSRSAISRASAVSQRPGSSG